MRLLRTRWRVFFLSTLLAVGALGLLYRLIDLTLFDRSFLLKQSQARIIRKISIPAYRGMITDRFGKPLAISIRVAALWANPKIFFANPSQWLKLSKILAIPGEKIKQLLHHYQEKEFVYLKRGLNNTEVKAIRQLKIHGLFFQHEYRRYYPEGEVTSPLIGITNIDDQGLEGLELAYNTWLSGTAGEKEVIKDRLGHIVADIGLLKASVQGHSLTLSLDHRIQYLAFVSLKNAIEKYHAASGSIVVLDAKTGEVLAMANNPAEDPNQRTEIKKGSGGLRNRALTDIFEPGSVIKPFTIAFALESKHYTPDTKIDTHSGWMKIGGYRITDDLNYGVVTLTQLLEKSSNIAAAKILLSLNPNQYWQLLRDFGFGEKTNTGFPGEAAGTLIPHTTWRPSVVATLAYGYGLAVNTLQLAQAYAVIADHGIKHPILFTKLNSSVKVPGKQIIPSNIAATLIQMLTAVVEEGTGTRARIKGYHVAGKTGTAYIAGPNGYDKHHYVASFVGLAPAEDAKVIVAVVIRDPNGTHRLDHFGAGVAAPVFAEVMSGTLRMLGL